MKVWTVAEWTVEMTMEVPFLQTFLMKDVQALQVMYLLRAQDRLEAYNTT
jgi:hypothetical protein